LEKGMAYALEAATKAQQLFAGDDAISYLNQALECAVSLGDRRAQASILENIGDVYSVIGPFDKAVAYYEQAAEMSTARKPAIGVKIGLVLNISNDERGVSILKDSLDELDAENDPLRVAQAFSALGRFHHYRCEYSAAIELYERARELAEPIGEPVSLGFIYSYFAGAYQHLAQLDKSLEWAHRAIELGEQTGYLVAIALGYEFIAEDNLIMGHWERTIEAARIDLKMAEKVGSVARKSWSLWAIGYARYGKGELSECIEAIEETAEFASAAGENRLLALCYTVLALAHAEMGNESALEFADQAVEASRAMVEIFQLGHSLQIKGYTHLQLGDPEKAFESFEESRKLLDQTESRDVSLYRLPYQAEALLLLGKLKEAREDLDEIIPLAVEVGAPHYEAAARRVQGLYFYEKGDLSAAEESLLEAIKITERLGSRIELARANYALTLVKQKSKDLREAKTHGKRAEQLFEACGASRYLYEMRMLLDQLD
jgi:tetratricopeptide (TPR) repeat protein